MDITTDESKHHRVTVQLLLRLSHFTVALSILYYTKSIPLFICTKLYSGTFLFLKSDFLSQKPQLFTSISIFLLFLFGYVPKLAKKSSPLATFTFAAELPELGAFIGRAGLMFAPLLGIGALKPPDDGAAGVCIPADE